MPRHGSWKLRLAICFALGTGSPFVKTAVSQTLAPATNSGSFRAARLVYQDDAESLQASPEKNGQDAEQLDVAPERLDVAPERTDMAPSPEVEQPSESSMDLGLEDMSQEDSGGGFLQPGKLISSYQWNYSDANRIFLGSTNLVAADQAVALASVQNEHVYGFELGIRERTSFIYELPFQYNNRSLNVAPLTGGALTGRLIQKNGGMADSRAYFRRWISPETDRNIGLYAGIKVPTGNERSGDFYQGRFLYDDISIQTGTGSWDPIFGFTTYRRFEYVTLFSGFNYRVTPKGQTSALALDPLLADPNSNIHNSVADQMSGDLGFNFNFGQFITDRNCCLCCYKDKLNGLVTSFAVLGAGVPVHDMIGSDIGYRRAFNAVFVRPGVTWTPKQDMTLFFNLPITVHRDLSVPGSFADVQFSSGLSYYW